MRIFFLVLVFFMFCQILPKANFSASAASLSKNLAQYSRDMEEYYINGKPEILPGLLRALDSQGVLADGEKRLFTAAFLAEIMRRDQSVCGRLLTEADNLNDNARKTMAWAAHLACLSDETTLSRLLPKGDDPVLRRQILASPAPLERWNIYSESSVLFMYWAAFLASGDARRLEAIIGAALHYADLNAAGLQGDADFGVAAASASLLYEQAPRHEAVRAAIRKTLAGAFHNGPKVTMLRSILRNSGR